MKTIFKVGMKVYDQFVFPNEEGEVIEISKNNEEYPVKVSLDGEKIRCSYTKDGRYGSNLTPSLSTEPYILQGFEQKALVPTYEEAFESLKKLIILRDYYNEGWQPDWNDNRITKWTIEVSNNNLDVTNEISFSRPLYFKTELLAEKFLEEQRELLETAKPLL